MNKENRIVRFTYPSWEEETDSSDYEIPVIWDKSRPFIPIDYVNKMFEGMGFTFEVTLKDPKTHPLLKYIDNFEGEYVCMYCGCVAFSTHCEYCGEEWTKEEYAAWRKTELGI